MAIVLFVGAPYWIEEIPTGSLAPCPGTATTTRRATLLSKEPQYRGTYFWHCSGTRGGSSCLRSAPEASPPHRVAMPWAQNCDDSSEKMGIPIDGADAPHEVGLNLDSLPR